MTCKHMRCLLLLREEKKFVFLGKRGFFLPQSLAQKHQCSKEGEEQQLQKFQNAFCCSFSLSLETRPLSYYSHPTSAGIIASDRTYSQ